MHTAAFSKNGRVAALLFACALLAASALTAFAAQSDKGDPYNPESGFVVVQPYGENVYKETPEGTRSEAWGEGRQGPHHLRRISPTEHLPAPPQVMRVIPTTGVTPR